MERAHLLDPVKESWAQRQTLLWLDREAEGPHAPRFVLGHHCSQGHWEPETGGGSGRLPVTSVTPVSGILSGKLRLTAAFPVTPLCPHAGRTRTSGVEQLCPSPTARQAHAHQPWRLSQTCHVKLLRGQYESPTARRLLGQTDGRQPCAPSSWARGSPCGCSAPQLGSEALQDLQPLSTTL